MNGSYWNWVIGGVIVAFIIYVTAKGRLGQYLSLAIFAPPTPSEPGPGETVPKSDQKSSTGEDLITTIKPEEKEDALQNEPSTGPFGIPLPRIDKLFKGFF